MNSMLLRKSPAAIQAPVNDASNYNRSGEPRAMRFELHGCELRVRVEPQCHPERSERVSRAQSKNPTSAKDVHGLRQFPPRKEKSPAKAGPTETARTFGRGSYASRPFFLISTLNRLIFWFSVE